METQGRCQQATVSTDPSHEDTDSGVRGLPRSSTQDEGHEARHNAHGHLHDPVVIQDRQRSVEEDDAGHHLCAHKRDAGQTRSHASWRHLLDVTEARSAPMS